jgi:hypothetical protein
VQTTEHAIIKTSGATIITLDAIIRTSGTGKY